MSVAEPSFADFDRAFSIRRLNVSTLSAVTPTRERAKRESGKTLITGTGAAVQRWLAERRLSGEITQLTYRNDLSRLRRLPQFAPTLDKLDRDVVMRYALSIGEFAPNTRSAYLATLRGFCSWCVDEQLIKEDPARRLPKVRENRRVPRARTVDEVGALLAACRNQRDRAMIVLMVQMGLRVGEVGRLTTADYDRDAQTMLIRGKGGHERVLPVPRRAAEEVGKYREAFGWGRGPLFGSRRIPARALSSGGVARIVTRIMLDAGVKQGRGDKVTPHTLRHTAASDVLERTGDIRATQAMLGHKRLATTELYLRNVQLGALREAMEGRDYRRGVLDPLEGQL